MFDGFAVTAELLQSHGAGEHGRFMFGKQRNVLIERFLGLRGAAAPNQGNAQSEVRIHAGGIGGQRFAEGLGGRFPLLRVSQAHAQVVVRRPMNRIQLRQRPVAGGGVFEIAQLELHVSQRGVESRVVLARLDGLAQGPGGGFAFALQVEGHGARESLVAVVRQFSGLVDRSHARVQEGP